MSARGRSLAVGALLACIGVVGVIACSSSSSGAAGCNQTPWQCGTGQTCGVQQCTCPSSQSQCTPMNCTPQFACIQSDNGVPEGQNCDLKIGTATCGDNQTCVEMQDSGAGNGVCRQYCDQNGGCPQGYTCTELLVGNSSVTQRVCLPPPLDMDANLGVDTGGGSGGSSSGGYDPDAWYEAGPFDGTFDGNQPHQ
ncbi:MAG TPA: hypothetical protein VMI75_08120 [Polyangiaceae bacterium]|nr:hypothetical protein [Polyangiaceae bacterium]